MLFLIASQWSRAMHRRKFALSNTIEMRTKQTVAIIGLGEMGRRLATALSEGKDRVLLFDKNHAAAQAYANELLQQKPSFDVEAIACSANACWEADIILLAVPHSEQNDVANYIKQYATQKIVVSLLSDNDNAQDALQELLHSLPHSKIVRAFHNINATQLLAPNGSPCLVEGKDEDALETIKDLVEQIGFTAITSACTKSKHEDETILVS
jgi:8-hydroxy-5-deazaflavin:NADPH oxidoreductase